jgi:hypothetical protein
MSWGAGIALGLAMLWIKPYAWPPGDLAQDLLPIMARLDATLFTRDFAVQSFLGPTPRIVFQHLVATVARLVPLPVAFFVLHTATLFLAGAALWALSVRIARPGRAAHAIAVAVMLAIGVSCFSTSGWSLPILAVGAAAPSTFAMGFALVGWVYASRRKWSVAFGMFGGAALLQLLVGVLPAMLLFSAFLGDRAALSRYQRTRAWVGLAFAVICAVAIAVPMVLGGRASGPASADIVRIYGHVRAPHHWLPSTAGSGYWIQAIVLVGCAFALARLADARPFAQRVARVSVAVIGATAACIVVNWLFVERFPVALVGKLQLQRTIPFAELALLSVMAVHFARVLEARRWLLVLALIAAPAARTPALTVVACTLALFLSARRPSLAPARWRQPPTDWR